MGGKSPDAPDYEAAAEKEAAASKEITGQQTWANRPTQITPWGTQSWTTQAVIDPSTGKPVTQWTSRMNLSPEEQAALNAQQSIAQGRSQGALELLNQAIANFSTPMNWNSMPQGALSFNQGGNQQQYSAYQTPGQAYQPSNQNRQMAAPPPSGAPAAIDPYTGAAYQNKHGMGYAAGSQVPQALVDRYAPNQAPKLSASQQLAQQHQSVIDQKNGRTPAPQPQPQQGRVQPQAVQTGGGGKARAAPPPQPNGSSGGGKKSAGSPPQPQQSNTLPSGTGEFGGGQTVYSRNQQGTLNAPQLTNGTIQGQVNQAAGDVDTRMQNTAGDWRQKGQDAALAFQKPLQEERQAGLESQLANMGLARGTEAWDREMRGLRDQDARDNLQAFSAGQSEANMLFGQDLASSQFQNQASAQRYQQLQSAAAYGDKRAQQQLDMMMQQGAFNNQNRQQVIAEEQLRRSQTLNELNALLTGQQVQMPTMPSFNTASKSETPQYMQAAQNQYSADMDKANAKNAQFQNIAGAAMMFSDARLKENVSTIEVLPSGVRIVEFSYKGDKRRFRGVIAQEVRKIHPQAVKRDRASGYLMVNYSEVH